MVGAIRDFLVAHVRCTPHVLMQLKVNIRGKRICALKMGNFVCDTCNKSYKYKRNLKRHMEEKHIQHEFWNCIVDGCKCKLIRRSYLHVHLQKVHGFSKVESRRAALGTKRGDCETNDSYYKDISEDESIFELLAEEEQMLAEQLPSVDEEAKDGGISEAETVVYLDDSLSMLRDSDDNTSLMHD